MDRMEFMTKFNLKVVQTQHHDWLQELSLAFEPLVSRSMAQAPENVSNDTPVPKA